MNKIDVLTREDKTARVPRPADVPRSPPRAVQLMLPVWGYSYVRQFLECGLPTLLAPGNIPAVAAALPTEFILLTSADDENYIREHPAFRKLSGICKTTVRAIDHLITDGNYSTTITLAFTEGVRAAGDDMVDTCFFFLVSDYIMADGSLGNALKRMQRGASAVVVGNFQVVHEDALPWLQSKLVTGNDTLALQPRELMQWALRHLHPAVLANMVDIPFSHNSHSNRLFWRVDENTILGRFYLMHMLCLRPEVTDFVIGSSCDYSFVPEMCPSGNVDTITDSDEYLVIEMQPLVHEGRFLQPGPLTPKVLARSLSEWTTAEHRANAQHSLVFHAEDMPPLKRANAAADAFLADVTGRLRSRPQPVRGHPYWRGAMTAFYDATGRNLTEFEWRHALGLQPSSSWLTNWLLWRAKYALMGRAPHVMPWHPAWPDLRNVLREIGPALDDPKQKLLIMSNEATAISLALADGGERVYRVRCVPFLRNPERYRQLIGKFDVCLLEIYEEDMWQGEELLNHIVPLMKPGARIVLFVRNQRASEAYRFSGIVAFHSERFTRSHARPTEVQFIPASRLRWMVYRGMYHLRQLLLRDGFINAPISVVGGGLLLGLSLVGNLDALRRTRSGPSRGVASSFIMRLDVDPAPRSPEAALLALTTPAAPPPETQYDRGVELANAVGSASLGPFTGKIWYENPRDLAVMLARYKFVARMLNGVRNAGEVGCGDAFGARIVMQEVPDVTVYDADERFIEDIRSRQQPRWPLKALLHDIAESPLPRRHDAILCLNMVDRIRPDAEYAFLANLCDSLVPNGLLILGVPAVKEVSDGGKPGTTGRLNGNSGKELKEVLEKYFERVLLFSMSGEAVQPGFYPGADYVFALASIARWNTLFNVEGRRFENDPLAGAFRE